MSTFNSRGVHFSTIKFFERTLLVHDKVQDVERFEDIFFRITLYDSRVVNALIVNEYIHGMAAVCEALEEFPSAEFVVNCGNWNSYTEDAKEYGLTIGVGIFDHSEFLGALNWANPISYVKKDED